MSDAAQSRRAFFLNAVAPRYATLGKTGLKVTTVGFGSMITSDMSVIVRAADMGINYFDTARAYGESERVLGAALKGRRGKAVISSKVLTRDAAGARQDLETSLRELGTDYLDIWFLHDVRGSEDLSPALLDVMWQAKRQGRVRHLGFSVHMDHRKVIPAALRVPDFEVMLTTYNYALGNSIDDLVRQARKAGLGIVAMKVMAGSFSMAGATGDRFQGKMKRPGAPVAALKWSLKTPLIDSAIPSIRDMEELEEDFQAMLTPYSSADEKLLAAQLERTGPLYCRGCGACAGACRQGLAVADLVRCAMYAEGYGQFMLGRESYRALPAGRRDARCGDCAGCRVRCPNGVNVAARVRRSQELFA